MKFGVFMCFHMLSGSMGEQQTWSSIWNYNLTPTTFLGETYNCMELTIYLGNKTQYIKKAWYRLQAPNRKGTRVERDE